MDRARGCPTASPTSQGLWSNTIGNHNNLTDPQGGGDDGRRGAASAAATASARRAASAIRPTARCRSSRGRARSSRSSPRTSNNPTRPEYVEPLARCAPGGPTKSFMWHGYEIRQYPGYVVFLFDSGTRVIHLDGKPHLPANIKLWNGDSRGRWEGNTLVVDVANNNAKARFGRTGEFVSEHAPHRRALHLRPDRRALHLRGAPTPIRPC